jgi:hypothetical protein
MIIQPFPVVCGKGRGLISLDPCQVLRLSFSSLLTNYLCNIEKTPGLSITSGVGKVKVLRKRLLASET